MTTAKERERVPGLQRNMKAGQWIRVNGPALIHFSNAASVTVLADGEVKISVLSEADVDDAGESDRL